MPAIKNDAPKTFTRALPATPPQTPVQGSPDKGKRPEDKMGPKLPPSPASMQGPHTAKGVATPQSIASSAASRRRPSPQVDVPVTIVGCSKGKYPKQTYKPIIGMEVSHLLNTDGDTTRLYMTKAQEAGGFGKHKQAMTQNGQHVAVKEMRTTESPSLALSRFGRPKTKPMTIENINKEAARTSRARAAIDGHIARRIQANGGVDPYGILRSHTTPFEVFETVQVGNKVHLVATLEAGDVLTIQDDVPLIYRAAFAVSVGAQMVDELEGLHAGGLAHLDLKAENLLFSASGQVKVADYGLSQTTKDGACISGFRGLLGTIFAPEMYPSVQLPGQPRLPYLPVLTGAVDVYVSAVVIMTLLERETLPVANPWTPVVTPDGEFDVEASAVKMASLGVFLRRAIGPDGQFRQEVLAETNNAFSPYFAHVYALAPHLVSMLASHCLNPDPQKRPPIAWLSQQMMHCVAALPSRQAAGAQQVFADAYGVRQIAQNADKLERYKAWHDHTHGGHYQRQYQMLR